MLVGVKLSWSGRSAALAAAAALLESLAVFFLLLAISANGLAAARAARVEVALLARALATQARALKWHDRLLDARRVAYRALETARATGAADAEAGALVSLGLIEEWGGAVDRAEELFTAAVERGHKDLSIRLRALFQHARVRYERGRLTGAARTADEGLSLARRTGLSLRLVRTGIEVAVVAIGLLLGGVLGLGTVVYALAIGPLTQLMLPWFLVELAPGVGAEARAGVSGAWR